MDIKQKIILELAMKDTVSPDAINAVKRRILRMHPEIKSIPSSSELLKSYHKLLALHKIKRLPELEIMLVKRAVRTLSGVAIVTVLTKPFPCPGNCIYCPTETGMPKSYLSDEPAANRALNLQFDPFRQVYLRIKALQDNGHPTEKIELIVKGGTWNAYPLEYQYWFIWRCFQGANAVRPSAQKECNFKMEKIRKLLLEAQKINEKAKNRIIGLTLETRPDFINEKTVWQMREMGCTRIELGVQTTDAKILKDIKRGHDVVAVKNATELLKDFGYKVDYHLMPQLPGSTPAKDLAMMLSIFSDTGFRPDMIKIYPCTVIKNSELYARLQAGQYKPYSDKKLVETIIKFKTKIPRYVRVSRLIRDIPGNHIEAGNKMTNLRQVIQAEMADKGLNCRCLRCREVGHNIGAGDKILKTKSKLFMEKYQAGTGTEYFLSFEDAKRNVVFAFCRLRINNKHASNMPYPAFIRELHTYGHLVAIGKNETKASQHTGLGSRLILEAEKICKKNKIKQLAVIAGVGVREYYKKLGYKFKNTYMVKNMI